MAKPNKPRAGPPYGTLAVAMIARDEERCIGRCLQSVRPWVDKIVVLDTGSSDNTKSLAQQAGAEVHEMTWPNSFSEARNHSLELANADWNIIIDADEWIASGGEQLRAWCQTPDRLGVVCVDSSFQVTSEASIEGTLSSNRNWITRILPRGVRFEGRVHEQVASNLPRTKAGLYFGHDGYLDAQMATKRDRNRPLLLLDLKERPGDPYILYQLGKEAEGLQEFGNACRIYRQALTASPSDANWLHCLVIRYLYCLGRCGKFDTAFDYARVNLNRWGHSPDFFFVLGNLALDKAVAAPADALSEWIPLAVSSWERCLLIGDQPSLEGSVQGRGSHFAQRNLDAVLSQLAGLAA